MDFYEQTLDFFIRNQISISIVLTTICVVWVASLWVLFEKAGEKGWKALIPFFNLYVLCKLTLNTTTFVEILVSLLIIMALTPILMVFGTKLGSVTIFLDILVLICLIFVLVNQIVLSLQVAQSFERNNWFGIGIFVFSFVFLPLLAFGQNKYVGNTTKN